MPKSVLEQIEGKQILWKRKGGIKQPVRLGVIEYVGDEVAIQIDLPTGKGEGRGYGWLNKAEVEGLRIEQGPNSTVGR